MSPQDWESGDMIATDVLTSAISEQDVEIKHFELVLGEVKYLCFYIL